MLINLEIFDSKLRARHRIRCIKENGRIMQIHPKILFSLALEHNVSSWRSEYCLHYCWCFYQCLDFCLWYKDVCIWCFLYFCSYLVWAYLFSFSSHYAFCLWMPILDRHSCGEGGNTTDIWRIFGVSVQLFVLKRFGICLIMFQISHCFEKAIWGLQTEYFQARNTVYFKWNIFLSFILLIKPPFSKGFF